MGHSVMNIYATYANPQMPKVHLVTLMPRGVDATPHSDRPKMCCMLGIDITVFV